MPATTLDAAAGVQVTPPPEGERWDQLSQWHLFSDIETQTPAAGVFAYDVNSPLFSDYAVKKRFLWIPKGATIGYDATGRWHFPVGTVLVKTFAYPDDLRQPEVGLRLLETRLLVRSSGGWDVHTYVYEDGQRDAVRKVAGVRLEIEFIDARGQRRQNRYAVPNTNQCRECHGMEERLDTLGGVTRQFDREAPDGSGNQIDRLVELGVLRGVDGEGRERLVDPFGDADLEERVRSYLDANCGHCHNDDVESADNGSGLWLSYRLTDPARATDGTLGICKMPQSAGGATCGRTFDLVPGDPDASILLCRVESDDPEVQMPPLGRNLVHDEGVELMRQWVGSLSDGGCR